MKKRYLLLCCSFFICFLWLIGCMVTPPTATVTQSESCQNASNQMQINQLQGAGHRSPYDGEEVRCIAGIVTVLDGGGFFMQSIINDDDPATSEGIYVDLLAFVSVKVGDEVMVQSGTIREFNPAGLGENSLTITSLRTSDVEVLSSGNTLPAPVVLGEGGRWIPNKVIENDVDGYVGQGKALFDPDQDGMDFYESLESTRVQINDAVAVSSINAYNEVVVVADRGRNTDLSSVGVLLLRQDDPNPERLMLDDKFIRMPEIMLGDVFTEPIIGIVDYDFGNFRIQPTEKLVFEAKGLVENIRNMDFLPELKPSQLSVVSLNLLNLSHVEAPERVDGFADMIVNQLGSPDILVLQEVMDDDGRLNSAVVSAEENIEYLVNAITVKGGPEYRWFNIDPERNNDGGVDGGNIRNMILFRLDRGLRFLSALPGKAGEEVGLSGEGAELTLTQNPGLIWPNNSAFRQSRKPLVAQFQFMDQNFFVIGVHFNSKGPDGPLYGDRQPPNLDSENQRIAQAKAVNGFVKDILERDPQAKIMVAGDMNDFPWSEPLNIMAGSHLVNLFETVESDRWFTYIHEGNAQVMDQMLVSGSFMQNLVDFRPLHLNSILPAKQQLSDHDPVIAVLDFVYYE